VADVLTAEELTAEVHRRLLRRYDVGVWHWRDDTPPLAICLGAILVQHTAWTNVERALTNLGARSLEEIAALPENELAALIRPAGTPLPKARRLRAFAALVLDHGGFAALFALPEDELRLRLLATHGIGPETADVILLYAARKPAVVHDAYTARLYHRLGAGPQRDSYAAWRAWLDTALPNDAPYRRADHAAIVLHCKTTCRSRPHCEVCPLLDLCDFGRAREPSLPSR
jgi:endonuclease-3 related protein